MLLYQNYKAVHRSWEWQHPNYSHVGEQNMPWTLETEKELEGANHEPISQVIHYTISNKKAYSVGHLVERSNLYQVFKI